MEGVVLMKKTRFAILLLSLLLLILLFLSGCDEDISPEISDHSDILSMQETAENPPREENAEEGAPLSSPLLEEEIDPREVEPPAIPEQEEGAPITALEQQGELPPSTEEGEEETPTLTSTYHYDPPASPTSTYTAACAKSVLHVRKGPSTNYESLFLLRAGESLPYLWREGEWLAVWTGSRVGYLHGGYAYLAETSPAIEAVIRAGLDKLGTPYEWGATRLITDRGTVNPTFTGKSFDCSSFVQYCYYIGAGIKLGNYTGSQADYTVGEKITTYTKLRRGDFYFTGNGTISHVVIYLGEGYLLQTYSANGGPVSVTTDERWRGKFLSGRRPDLTVTEQYQ